MSERKAGEYPLTDKELDVASAADLKGYAIWLDVLLETARANVVVHQDALENALGRILKLEAEVATLKVELHAERARRAGRSTSSRKRDACRANGALGGRPRTRPPVDPDAPKRPRGRPRKTE
jgi:hypothetical protein